MKTILRVILASAGVMFVLNANAQRAKEGDYTVSTADEVVNTYTSLTASASAGATSITVADNSMTGGAFGATPLAPGDLILIVQMYGGTVDVYTWYVDNGWGSYTVPTSYGAWQVWWGTDPQTFGQVLSYENAGKFERAEVVSVSGSNTINLSCGLDNNYTSSNAVQIVRIPRFNNLTVDNATSIVPTLWNGTTGGIVALEVDGAMTLNAGSLVSASGYGYRGGSVDALFNPGSASTDVSNPERFLGSSDGIEGSEKGESIYGFTAQYNAIFSRYGKGAIANGGGGGGYVNAGGGGGSNAEVAPIAYNGHGNPDNSVAGYVTAWGLDATVSSSSGGGRGGYCLSQNDLNATTTGPVDGGWGGDARKNNGGWGGHPLTYDATRMFFGGGGGAGEQDSGQGGAGGRGGGIVYIINYGSITGSGSIEVNGENGQNSNPNNEALGFSSHKGNDGAGGAGAGGTVYIENALAIPNTISINAIGGDGGDQALQVNMFQPNEAGGPGGSGSGGVIRFSSGAPTQSVAAGVNGETTSTQLSEFPANGATMGSEGEANLPAPFYDLIPTDVSICSGQTATPSVAVSGSYTGTLDWYTQQFGGTPIAGQSDQLSYSVSPVATTTYWVGVCGGSFRVPVTVTVTSGPTLITTDPEAECSPATVDITIAGVTVGSDAGTLTYWIDNLATVAQPTPTAVGSGWHYIQLDTGGGCTAIDSVFVTVNPLDDATFVSSDFCESTTNSISGVLTGGGSFAIQSQTGTATIDAGTGILSGFAAGDQITIEYTTPAGGCQNSSTQVVNVNALDDATFVSNDFCVSTTNTISGVVTGGGTYAIQSQTGTATIDAGTGILSGFAAGDQITIEYTTPVGGCQNSSTQVVNVNALDDATFVSSDFCVSTTNSISGVVTGGGTFAIQSQTGTATIDAGTGILSGFAAGDQITIEYTTPAGGCQNSSTQVVNVTNLDDATFVSTDFCESTTNSISGVVTGGGTYAIQSQSGTATIDAGTGILSGFAAGDQITIEYTTPVGACQNSSTQVVNVNALDDATFVSSDFCESATNSISGVVTGGGTYAIQSQTGTATIDAGTGILSGFAAGDQITIEYTTPAGACQNSSTQVVNVTNLDDATFVSTDFCESTTNSISGVVTSGGTYAIQSQTGAATIDAGTGILSGFAAGDQITIEYTTPVGACQNSSTQIVNVTPLDDATFVSTDFCESTTNTVSGVITGGGTYAIQSQTGTATIDVGTGILSGFVAGDQITIEYTTPAGGCQNSSTQVVNVNALDDATFVSSDFCESTTNSISGVVTVGGTFAIQSQTGTATIDAGTGILSGAVAGDQITIEYTTPVAGCQNSSTVTVNVTSLDDATFVSTDFCESTTNSISGVVTGGGTFAIQSQTGTATIDAGTGILSGFAAGDQITIEYTTPVGACQNVSTQAITVLSNDDGSFAMTENCDGGTANVSGLTGGTFTFNVVPTDAAVIDASSGTVSGGMSGATYVVDYTTNGACPVTTTQSVIVLQQDDASFALTPTCDGVTSTILGTPDGTFSLVTPVSGASIDAQSGTVTGADYNASIEVMYSSGGACPDNSTEIAIVDDCSTSPEIVIPTAFTPGFDGMHDDWEIVELDNLYPDNTVTIFNRWGNKVYEHTSSSANPYDSNRWDGKYNGTILPVASYYYIIETNDGSGTSYQGTVTLVQ